MIGIGKLKRKVVFNLCFSLMLGGLFLSACNSGESPKNTPTKNNQILAGELSTGGRVYFSTDTVSVDKDSQKKFDIRLVGGNLAESYQLSFANEESNTNVAVNAISYNLAGLDNGFSVRTDPVDCVLSSDISSAVSSNQCSIAVETSATTPAGKYAIKPLLTLRTQKGNLKLIALKPVNILVSGVISPDSKKLASFEINANPGKFIGNEIIVTVPYGTDISNLKADFVSTGAKTLVNEVNQSSGNTPNDFTFPVNYTIIAQDGTSQEYEVKVIVAADNSKEITAFKINGVNAVINNNDIILNLPFDTEVSKLAANFVSTGAKVLVNGVEQINGFTLNDFSKPVIYQVIAADGSIQSYRVKIVIAPSSIKELTGFSVNGESAVIVGNQVSLKLPAYTNLTQLVASFNFNGAKVEVNGILQTSGNTPNNFSLPVVYKVYAKDGSTKEYNVNITTLSIPALADFTVWAGEPMAEPFVESGMCRTTRVIDDTGKVTGYRSEYPMGPGGQYPWDVAKVQYLNFVSTGNTYIDDGQGGFIPYQFGSTVTHDFSRPRIIRVVNSDGATQDFTITFKVSRWRKCGYF